MGGKWEENEVFVRLSCCSFFSGDQRLAVVSRDLHERVDGEEDDNLRLMLVRGDDGEGVSC